MAENNRQRCTAPGCMMPAKYLAKGTDYDGTEFEDPICDCAAGLMSEHGADVTPLPQAPEVAERKCEHCGKACERQREEEDPGYALWECIGTGCGWWTEEEDPDYEP